MKLTVVIVSYNVRHYLEQCLRSLARALEGVDAQVCVIDNHSKDHTVETLRPLFPEVRFVASHHNLGFARANNIVIRQTESDYVLLLNPDTIVGETCIRHCLDFMDAHADAGALGVKMHTPTGQPANESRRGVPTPMVAFYKMSGLCKRFPQSRRFGKYYMSYLPWNEPAEIEVVSGAFCMLRRAALVEAGTLDEDFFMYGEDIDLSYRLLKHGFHNWYLPERLLHYKGESTQKSSFRYVHVFYDAMLIFFRKHFGHLSVLLSVPIKAAIYVKAFTALLSMMKEKTFRALGFRMLRARPADTYLFVGRKDMLDHCRTLATIHALEADFLEGDARLLPQGHLAQTASTKRKGRLFVAYDTAAYSYEQVFAIFEQAPDESVRMAFYHAENNTLITENDILQ